MRDFVLLMAIPAVAIFFGFWGWQRYSWCPKCGPFATMRGRVETYIANDPWWAEVHCERCGAQMEIDNNGYPTRRVREVRE